ncbi:MAG: ribonuclease HI [Treponema sp.]|jgi:ribonuclease HI|nr:ribonuclease HI [Treponema sp.]
MQIKIYTDGACSGNPGPGGWAFVIIREDGPADGPGLSAGDGEPVIAEKWGAEKNTTNNRMELRAVIAALETLEALNLSPAPERVAIHTDSQYAQKGMNEWIHSWKKSGWRTSAKTPVKNRDLWQRLDELASRFPVSWVWVKGHAGNENNERCDSLCRTAVASLED